MAPTTQQQRPQQQREQEGDPDFKRMMSGSARLQGLRDKLYESSGRIEAMLPDFMKGQADRLIARAMITFAKCDLKDCPDEDFRRCVVEAAEMGFAIDGKLAYVVKYKAAYQLQLDYKAMVAVAKRCRTLKDVQADVVCEGDEFRHARRHGENILEHTFQLGFDRGNVIGAYCRVWLPDGSWNYALMDRNELNAIQDRAPSKKGPWSTDPNEMRKKTVIRRALKMYQDDPGLMRMLDITGWEDELDEPKPALPATLAEMSALMNKPAKISGSTSFETVPNDPQDSTPEEQHQHTDKWKEIEDTFGACLNLEMVDKWAAECRKENPGEGDIAEINRLAGLARERFAGEKKQQKTLV